MIPFRSPASHDSTFLDSQVFTKWQWKEWPGGWFLPLPMQLPYEVELQKLSPTSSLCRSRVDTLCSFLVYTHGYHHIHAIYRLGCRLYQPVWLIGEDRRHHAYTRPPMPFYSYCIGLPWYSLDSILLGSVNDSSARLDCIVVIETNCMLKEINSLYFLNIYLLFWVVSILYRRYFVRCFFLP